MRAILLTSAASAHPVGPERPAVLVLHRVFREGCRRLLRVSRSCRASTAAATTQHSIEWGTPAVIGCVQVRTFAGQELNHVVPSPRDCPAQSGLSAFRTGIDVGACFDKQIEGER